MWRENEKGDESRCREMERTNEDERRKACRRGMKKRERERERGGEEGKRWKIVCAQGFQGVHPRVGPAPDTTLTPPFLWGGKVPLSPCSRSLSLLLLRPCFSSRAVRPSSSLPSNARRVEYVRLRCAVRYFVSLRGTRTKACLVLCLRRFFFFFVFITAEPLFVYLPLCRYSSPSLPIYASHSFWSAVPNHRNLSHEHSVWTPSKILSSSKRWIDSGLRGEIWLKIPLQLRRFISLTRIEIF